MTVTLSFSPEPRAVTMKHVIWFWFSQLSEEEGRTGTSASVLEKQQVEISVHKLRCANIQLKFLFHAPIVLGGYDFILGPFFLLRPAAFPVGFCLSSERQTGLHGSPLTRPLSSLVPGQRSHHDICNSLFLIARRLAVSQVTRGPPQLHWKQPSAPLPLW